MIMNGKFKLIIAMLIYGSIGVFVKNISFSAVQIAFLRAFIGSGFLLSVSLIMGKAGSTKIGIKELVIFVLSGAALGINWLFLFKAFEYTSVSTAILVYYLAPIIVIMLSPMVLKEKLTLFKLVCAFIAVVGLTMVVLSNCGLNELYSDGSLGILYALAAAFFYAGVILINKRFKSSNGFETTIIQLGASVLVLLPILIIEGGFHGVMVDMNSVIMITILGVLHTGIAYLLYFSSMKNLSAQTVALYCYIDPISAMVFSWMFLGESMKLNQIIGGILILGATYFIDREDGHNVRYKSVLKKKTESQSSMTDSYVVNYYQRLI
jgi:drug/metabolite transporter (DMT)-like permease